LVSTIASACNSRFAVMTIVCSSTTCLSLSGKWSFTFGFTSCVCGISSNNDVFEESSSTTTGSFFFLLVTLFSGSNRTLISVVLFRSLLLNFFFVSILTSGSSSSSSSSSSIGGSRTGSSSFLPTSSFRLTSSNSGFFISSSGRGSFFFFLFTVASGVAILTSTAPFKLSRLIFFFLTGSIGSSGLSSSMLYGLMIIFSSSPFGIFPLSGNSSLTFTLVLFSCTISTVSCVACVLIITFSCSNGGFLSLSAK